MDDERLVYKCCSLYYEEDLSQKEIAEKLHISKASVSRILQKGKELGIVEIRIHHLSKYMYEEQETILRKKYHLKDVIIAESSPMDSVEKKNEKLTERAADYLNRLFRDKYIIGVSLGTILNNIANAREKCSQRNYTFVPLIGGFNQFGVDNEDIQSNQVAEAFARKFGGTYIPFYSPAIFSNQALLNLFLQEKAISHVYQYFHKLDVVISGMSSMPYQTIEKLGYISPNQIKEYQKKGAACNLLLRFMDIHGHTEQFSDYNNRVAGISLEQYKKIDKKILVANGKENALSVKTCIKNNYVNILITDIECAKELLSF